MGGRRQLTGGVDVGAGDEVFSGPELRARQSAEALGLTPAVDPRLADLGGAVPGGAD